MFLCQLIIVHIFVNICLALTFVLFFPCCSTYASPVQKEATDAIYRKIKEQI